MEERKEMGRFAVRLLAFLPSGLWVPREGMLELETGMSDEWGEWRLKGEISVPLEMERGRELKLLLAVC